MCEWMRKWMKSKFKWRVNECMSKWINGWVIKCVKMNEWENKWISECEWLSGKWMIKKSDWMGQWMTV